MSNVFLAKKTIAAIDAAIEADQGATYRQHLQKVLPHIKDAYRGAEESPFRLHLGASIVGGECGRKIWYSFRWATVSKFPGRILRLFNRGHLEEARVIAAFLTIGVQVFQQDENGNQFRISDAGGHFGGSGDGILLGVPDLAPEQYCILECKTHNDSSFKKLIKDGVRNSKFEHYVQMNVYLRKMGLAVAMYVAVNKNDDSLYMELVPLNSEIADQFIDRGQQIVFMRDPPKRISDSPGWFACSWCDHKPVCYLKAAPARNCRTCVHSVPREDGNWYCTEESANAAFGDNVQLSEAAQLRACQQYKVFF